MNKIDGIVTEIVHVFTFSMQSTFNLEKEDYVV